MNKIFIIRCTFNGDKFISKYFYFRKLQFYLLNLIYCNLRLRQLMSKFFKVTLQLDNAIPKSNFSFLPVLFI